MKQELKDINKLLDIKNLLDSFFISQDCDLVCEKCNDKRICDYMYQLEKEVRKYIAKLPVVSEEKHNEIDLEKIVLTEENNILDKIKEIKKIKPRESQLLIRTDVETDGWFIHFYLKQYEDERGWIRAESYVRGFFTDEQVDNVLDSILEYCRNGRLIRSLK